jgi:hypothetical protein
MEPLMQHGALTNLPAIQQEALSSSVQEELSAADAGTFPLLRSD